MNKGVKAIPELVKRLYGIVNELESHFPGRKFTPDGHLIGSIGEVLVAEKYNLDLLPNSAKTHDAVDKDGRLIQIKATQGVSIGISSEPDWLIVVKINKEGVAQEVYFGLGKPVWENAGKMQKNGQRRISLNKLRKLETAHELRL
jgi:hypothetical protein